MACSLSCGSKLISDVLNPRPEEIDVEFIDSHLFRIQRFSGSPKALSVGHHVRLAAAVARFSGADPAVVGWLERHDDHEAIIGDIPGPLKAIIAGETSILTTIETRLDVAIWEARGGGYELPYGAGSAWVGRVAHGFDKMAETLEWHLVMGNPIMPWCKDVPRPVWDVAPRLIEEALNV